MFETAFFASPKLLLLGAITGFVFGFLLQKAHVSRFDVIVNQFLLKDFTVVKVILSAVVVGGVGIYLFQSLGLIEGLHIKSATLLANAIGGGIFALGMVLLGYCPGTGVAALGDGAKDAGYGVLGMLFGSALYAESHDFFSTTILRVGDLGKVTLPTLTGLSPWYLIGLLVVAVLAVFVLIERFQKQASG